MIGAKTGIYSQGSGDSFVGILDDYPGASWAMAFFQLSASQPKCLEVYRVSDGATLDIDYDTADPLRFLNTSDILTFVGVGEGRVKTMYDPSGNNNHLVQTTPASMPRIANGGAIDLSNLTPAMFGTQAQNKFMQHTTPVGAINSGFEVYQAAEISASLTRDLYRNTSTIAGRSVAGSATTNPNFFDATNTAAVGLAKSTSQRLESWVNNGLTFETWVNAANNTSTSPTLNLTGINRIWGRSSNTSFAYSGYTSLIIWYPNDQTANVSAIETRINDVLNIYP